MNTLYDPLQAGDLFLANRVVMAPLTRNRAPRGVPHDLHVTYYTQRASAGLIVSEGTAISPMAQGYAQVPGLYTAEQLAGWRRVTEAVHAAGGRIVVQLWHVGRVSHTSLLPDGQAPVAPSALQAQTRTYLIGPDGQGSFQPVSAPRALRIDELPALVADYARAARAAVEEAGFDGVEIHAANGYLLDQFLKTGANQRTDAYGGTIENRARLLLEVTRAVAEAIGPGRTGIRLSPITPANDIVDADPQPLFEHVVRALAPLGLAFLHLIEGATGGPRELPDRPFDFDALRRAYRNAGGRGAWIVNNGYDKTLAEAAVAQGRADAVAFGRLFISNPDLVRRLREGAPLNAWDVKTFYGGGAQGYIDYPALV
ncbi:alkene reductase [Caldimonas manganoxidans]|uniref:alkene reductase n=1 Tax=Caldimonas manganoxidans TaxID=196015 RepID=UPI0003763B50|nr:alkene reductase [Caldimonas manganoxidans]